MTPATSASVTIKRRFDADQQTLFDAWLDPGIARHWLFTRIHSVRGVDIDPRVGGRFTITDGRKDGEVVHAGEYLEIVPPTHLRMRLWLAEMPNDTDTLDVDIVPDADGSMLTVVHHLAPAWSSFREQTRIIWGEMLDELASALGA